MAATGRNAPTHLLLPAAGAGLLLGLLIGLVLGWQVWPVRWIDTDPADLRLEHQIDHVIATADALAATGDAAAAHRRLEALIDADTSWAQVANLVMRVAVSQDEAGDRASGDRIRAMYDALAMPSPLDEEFALASSGPSRGVWIGAGALGLGAVACLGWLALNLGLTGRAPQAARPAAQRPRPAAGAPTAGVPAAGAPAAVGGQAPRPHRPLFTPTAPLAPEPPAPGSPSPAYAPPAQAVDDGEDDWEDDEEAYGEDTDGEAPAYGGVAREDRDLDEEGVLGAFEAEYRLGDHEFDCSFSIEDEEGNFLGECGVGVTDMADGSGATALEVWLFDKQDIRTVSTLVVSEYAYHDDALNARLASKGDLELAQQGLCLVLESLTLQVTATVRSYSYAKGGPGPNSVFSHLSIELLAEPAEEA